MGRVLAYHAILFAFVVGHGIGAGAVGMISSSVLVLVVEYFLGHGHGAALAVVAEGGVGVEVIVSRIDVTRILAGCPGGGGDQRLGTGAVVRCPPLDDALEYTRTVCTIDFFIPRPARRGMRSVSARIRSGVCSHATWADAQCSSTVCRVTVTTACHGGKTRTNRQLGCPSRGNVWYGTCSERLHRRADKRPGGSFRAHDSWFACACGKKGRLGTACLGKPV